MIGQAFHWANLTVAFLLELCALAALGYWGLRAASGPAAKAALGIGAPLLAAVLWGLFAAPPRPRGRKRRPGEPLRGRDRPRSSVKEQ
jgi:hypothetical protein